MEIPMKTLTKLTGLASVAAISAALILPAPASADPSTRNTLLGAGAGAVAGGLLTHGSAGGIVGGAVVGGVAGHVLSHHHHHYHRRYCHHRYC
jgi:osmotically inducible lipoprotein OsmB